MLPSSLELEYFLEVATTLNLSRASERLGISQPSLSIAVKKLEKNLGIKLFTRHQQGMALTQAGKQLLTHTKTLINYWNNTKSLTIASQQDIRGSFVLGCHSSLARNVIINVLPLILKKYPDLEMHLKFDVSRKTLEQINNFQIDLGIVVNPIKHPDLIMHKLYQDEMSFWVNDEKNIINDIYSDQAVILCDPDLKQTKTLLHKCKQKKLNIARIIHINDLDLISELTAKGCGIGILPASISKKAKSNLRKVSLMPTYAEDIYLIYHGQNRDTKAMQIIIKLIKDCIKAKEL